MSVINRCTTSEEIMGHPAAAVTTTYRITVYTGNVEGAGTNANVFITLYGERPTPEQDEPNSGERQLDNGLDNFEANAIDLFSIETRSLGNLVWIRIRHDNQNSRAGWFLDKVVISDEMTGKEWLFPCARWLASDEDDRHIERVLPAV